MVSECFLNDILNDILDKRCSASCYDSMEMHCRSDTINRSCFYVQRLPWQHEQLRVEGRLRGAMCAVSAPCLRPAVRGGEGRDRLRRVHMRRPVPGGWTADTAGQ